MQPFRFVHAADLHIDSPFKGLRDIVPEIADRLEEATHEAFRNLIRLCRDEKADFLVIAGDVFDDANRSPRAQLRFWRGLDDLAKSGIESFVVHGNHDPLDGRFASTLSWPEGVHVFQDPEPAWATATSDGRPVAEVQGISYPTRDVFDNLALRFSPPRNPGLFSIGLLHCNVGGDTAHPNYAPCTVNDLVSIGLDYWALGHIHKRQTLRESRPAVVYPGNIQGRDPGEPGARGCMVVDVDAGGSATTRFMPLDVVRWESCEVPIDGAQGVDELTARIESAVDDLRSRAAGRDVVCRVALTGRGPLHTDLARDGALNGLLEELRDGVLRSSPWVWIERLSNQTRPAIDPDARSSQDDFLGSVLREAAAMDPDAVRELLAPVFSGRRGGLPAPTDEEIRPLIEEARWYLADLLEPEE